MADHDDSAAQPIGELASRISEQVSRLVRDELRLAQAEVTEKAKKAGIGAGLFGGAGVVALYGVAGPVPDWAAALIVAAVLLAAAGATALLGRREVTQAMPPMPQEAVAGVKQDIRTVKE